jgi:hypothetical protein
MRCTPGAARTGCATWPGLHRFDPDGQAWARSMADLLHDANARAASARRAGHVSLSDQGATSAPSSPAALLRRDLAPARSRTP